MTINALSPRLIPVPTQSQYPASGLSAAAAGTDNPTDSASEFTFLWRSHSLVGPSNFEDEQALTTALHGLMRRVKRS